MSLAFTKDHLTRPEPVYKCFQLTVRCEGRCSKRREPLSGLYGHGRVMTLKESRRLAANGLISCDFSAQQAGFSNDRVEG